MRRRRAEKRSISPDTIHNNILVAKLINIVMKDGKKSLAERIVYKALEGAKQKTGKEAMEVFSKAVENVRPLLAVKSRRIGGATYQVPIEVRPDRGRSLALRWIRNSARSRRGKPMQENLADELVAAYKNEGPSVKRKEDTHKMAEANKAFAHFRW